MLLLIVAALGAVALVSMIDRTESLGMTALVEVHTEEEADRPLQAGARVIGVTQGISRHERGSRLLRAEFAPGLLVQRHRIAESGIRGPPICSPTRVRVADAVLVGEGLVTSGDPRSAVADLVTAGHASVLPETRPLR